MSPEAYRGLRESLGDRLRAARVLDCSPVTIRLRESGHHRITDAAAERLHEAVHAAALDEDARRNARHLLAIVRREEHLGITPAEFEEALDILGWTTRKEAARHLLGEPLEYWRISDWSLGRTAIPDWVARHLRDHLGLGPGDPFPAPTSAPGHRRRWFTSSCTPGNFRYALHLLGWSQAVAAEKLGVANKFRVSDWCRGYRPVPRYIERHLRTLLDIGPDEPWPTRHPELVLPDWLRPYSTDAGEGQ